MPVVQRLLPVGAVRRTHADCHEAAVGYGDRRWLKWRLYEVLRSKGCRDTAGAVRRNPSPLPGLVVSTLRIRSVFRTCVPEVHADTDDVYSRKINCSIEPRCL